MKFYFLDRQGELLNKDEALYNFLIKHSFEITSSLDLIEDIYLFLEGDDLCVGSRLNPKVLPLKVDLLSARLRRRLTNHNIQSEFLNKCLGKKNSYKTVLDATAGMGTDSILFAGLGLNVVACEKSPFIYLLLKNGLLRAKNDSELGLVAQRIQLLNVDSLKYLQDSDPFDLIYMDFMFSSEDKKSKSKKDMEFFKKINIQSQDMSDDEQLDKYLVLPFKRLIYKRPLKSSILRKHQYSHSLKGKAIRFDIYVA